MNMVPNKKYRRSVFQVVLFFNLLIFACVSFADEEQIQEIKYPIEKLHEKGIIFGKILGGGAIVSGIAFLINS